MVFVLSVVMFAIVTVNCETFEEQETKPAINFDRERREVGLFDEEFAKRGRGMRYRSKTILLIFVTKYKLKLVMVELLLRDICGDTVCKSLWMLDSDKVDNVAGSLQNEHY